ncbi:oxygenase [Lithospermum erythrorhizon]|uniref:Oxygenase n=1 Tax=Lithospermum erythrorhizon TaxID=34254 RepID=A0AAV3RA83_LITER
MRFISIIHLLYLFIAACTYVIINLMKKKKRPLPPGPGFFSTIRILFSSSQNAHAVIAKLANIYGPIMTIKLGGITSIVISSPEMAKDFIQQNTQSLSGKFILSSLNGKINYQDAIPWLSAIDPWIKVRKMCKSEIFSTKRLDELQVQRYQVLDEMVKTIVDACKHGELVSIKMLVFGTKFNMVSKNLFSGDSISLRSKAMEEMKETMDGIAKFTTKPNVGDYFPFLNVFDLQGIGRNVIVYYNRLYDFLDGVIDQRKKQREAGLSLKNGDFLDFLLHNCLPNGNNELLSLHELKLVITELSVGGTHTITSTVEWAMVELLQNSNIMAKVKQELAEKIKVGEEVKEQNMAQLPYLAAVIKETMRLHTMALLLLPHRTEAETEINGYKIPKNSHLLVNSWYMSRDEKYWDEPLKFMPERFIMKSNIDFIGNQLCFMPFGAGKRLCAGMPLAIRIIFLVLATLVHKFDWEVPEGKTPKKMIMEDKYGVTLYPKLIE